MAMSPRPAMQREGQEQPQTLGFISSDTLAECREALGVLLGT